MFDIVVIGSGLGGLTCGLILSKAGYNVCVVEKHKTVGGCLQSFRRRNSLFDTGIHYIGSLDEGQIMAQYFKYFGIDQKITTQRLDADAFEVINIEGKQYKMPLGQQNFVDNLSQNFPEDAKGIDDFIHRVMTVSKSISVENLRRGLISQRVYTDFMSTSTYELINSCVSDPTLRNILAGNSLLYGGEKDTASFYGYAMVVGSNIEGAHKIIGGTQSVADAMADQIRRNGGTIITDFDVTRIAVADGKVTHIEARNGQIVEAKNVISSLHPATTFNLTDRTPAIKKAYITRLNELKNSYGVFSLYITLKPNALPYTNSIIYIHTDPDTWSYAGKNEAGKRSIMISQHPSADGRWADTMVALTPMYSHETEQWNDTTVGHRPDSYEAFKQRVTDECLGIIGRQYPEMVGAIDAVYSSSPLTFRDYTGTPGGTAYGVVKNFANPLPTLFSTRTKIPNLHLTGQSLFVHGAIGVIMTATITCAEFVDAEQLAKQIGNA